ncbi:MAG: hypothetical protein IKS52_06175 [Clostridia bacterium]|nr:hypothetical protein [Clostridia bacterium]
MTNNGFAQKLIEVLLSWIRLVTSWVWNFFQADMAGGFLTWFADNWMSVALALIVIGLVVDWLIWMIRWRPYWLWLRKRQIIYEEVETPREKKISRPEPVRHMPKPIAQSEYDDPFASGEIDPYALSAPKQSAESALDEWDSDADPYEAVRSDGRSIYARPAVHAAAPNHQK